MNKKPKLMPCPFCSGTAEFALGKTGDGKDWHYVECTHCSAMGPQVEYARHKEQLLEALANAWNLRSPTEVSKSAADVIAERQRQISAEGWTPDHDDEHNHGELAAAAAAYAFYRSHVPPERIMGNDAISDIWPFSPAWWKPTNRRRDLVKAGALILAEIERLDRLETKAQGDD